MLVEHLKNTEERRMNNGKIVKFTDLNAWQKAHELCLKVYSSTKKFPREELFCLTSQIRRAVISTSSNIAEGFSRLSPKEKIQFYRMALGSLTEVQNQLILARDLGYINSDELQEELIIDTHKLINGLIKATRSKLLSS